MDNNLDELIPLYHEYSDTKIFKETRIRYLKLIHITENFRTNYKFIV